MPDETITLSLPIEIDDDGFLDRQCPWSECSRTFKVLDEDWNTKLSPAVAHCPFCGHEAEPSEFTTPEQLEYFREATEAEVRRQLGLVLDGVVRDFNRRAPTRGPITMRMDVSSPRVAIPLQPAALDAMALRIKCERCQCQFAVVGAGFFCPACGHNSADQTLDQAIAAARNALAVLPSIADNVADPDVRDTVSRHLIQAQIVNLVTAFQRFAEVSYPLLPGYEKAPRQNAFQNISEGDDLWAGAGGTRHAAILDPSELDDLNRLFQQRHLLAHQEGIVDAKYLARSNDRTYVAGQRLVIRPATVQRLAELIEKLVAGLRRDIHGAPTPTDSPTESSTGGASGSLPRIAGTTSTDVRVFQLACEHALSTGEAEVGGRSLWRLAEAAGISRAEFIDAVEILKSKHLFTVAWPIGRDALPALVTISSRGLELFLSHVIDNYTEVRRQIACQVVAGVSTGRQIEAAVSQPTLVVRHVLSDFANRRWLYSHRAGSEISVAEPKVELRRLCQGEPGD